MEEQLAPNLYTVVKDHYSSSSSPLLLAHLGHLLRKLSIWPPKDDPTRTLRNYIERECNGTLQIVQDPLSRERIAVTDQEHFSQVQAALTAKSHLRPILNLSSFPRTVLLAFCVSGDSTQSIYLRKEAPHSFRTQKPSEEEAQSFWEIKPEFRLRNLRLTDPKKLSPADRSKLENSIVSWCADLKIPVEELQTGRGSPKSGTALQRFIHAQTADVQRGLLIPADIALLLLDHE
jgi:hypothetical protein